MVAARAFLAERKKDLPVAIIVFNPNVNVLSDFTTDKAELAAAVAETPTTAEGTHIYDALIEAVEHGARTRGSSERRSSSSPTARTSAASASSLRRGARSAATTRTSASSRSGSSRRSTRRRRSRRSRTARAARTSRPTTPPSSQPIFTGDRPAALERVRDHLPLAAPAAARRRSSVVDGRRATRPRRRSTRRPRSTSRRRARSSGAGSTRSSRRRGS